MSVSAMIEGGLEISDPAMLVTTDMTDIFTASDRDTIVASISVVNEANGSAKVTLFRHDGQNDFAIWHQIVAADTTHIITEIPIRLYSGEALCGKSDRAGAVTITPIIIRTGSYEAQAYRAG